MLESLASLLDLDLGVAWEENESRDVDESWEKGSELGIYVSVMWYVSPRASASEVEVEVESERGCMKSMYMFGWKDWYECGYTICKG